VKPAVSSLGFELVDMRDAAEAGIIDNVMRARIRDASFVLVDLTHANEGAYWEAGYAEGLGKPVLYLCNRQTFEQRGTHFDTNHCTTVLWDAAAPGPFIEELKATLRRSLGLFAS
jgi:nucleoside 2-deoxyribosyltransferase